MKVFKKRIPFSFLFKVTLSFLTCCTALAGSITKTNTFTAGETISASKVNANFDQLFTEMNAKDVRLNKFEAAITPLANGNVGVGTTNPGTALEVNGVISRSCTTTSTGANAVARWAAGNNHCFMRFDTAVTFENAAVACRNLGGYLVTINRSDELTFLQNNLITGTTNFHWIGFSDAQTEGQWRWITGEFIPLSNTTTYTNWAAGEPNGGTSESCGLMYGAANSYQWNDAGCSGTFNYICERDL